MKGESGREIFEKKKRRETMKEVGGGWVGLKGKTLVEL